MNELDTARAIAAGELPSPQRMGAAWLFSVRISGTGHAARTAKGESCYRPPEVWTSDEMVARASGLPVVFGHPPSGTLDSDTYAQQSVGTIIFPFVAGNELHGIARVFDDTAASAMASGEFSTSPSVVFGPGEAASLPSSNGPLLIETSPLLLDHVAVVANPPNGSGGGVWDKGGPATGIRNDSQTTKGPTMADETDDASAKLDKILGGMDALTTMCGSLAKRMDAIETAAKEAPTKDTAKADDDTVYTEMDADGLPPSKTGWTDKQRTMADAEEAQKNALLLAQSRADEVCNAWGMRADKPMMGEKLINFRRRLLNRHRQHSKEFGSLDLSLVTDPKIFDAIETKIFADSMAASCNPVAPVGYLREIVKTDRAGRQISNFYGEPKTWMQDFACERQRLIGIRNRNYN